MKKIVGVIIGIIFVFLTSVISFADFDEEDNLKQIENDLSQRIQEGIDDEILQQLEEENIDLYDFETLKNISSENIFEKILSVFKMNFGKTVKLTAKIIVLIILTSLVKSFVPQGIKAVDTFSFVSVGCCASVIVCTFQECINSVVNTLGAISTFMNCYVPVYTSVLLTSGNSMSATAYNVAMFSVCQIVSYLANEIIIPVISFSMCLCIVGAINPELAFGKVVNGIKKIIQWILGTLMTITVAVLGIQSVIGASADTVATKTAKYAMSTFVPFIGGAVSETYLTVKSSLGIIRSGIGSIGIIIVLFFTIKPVVIILLGKFSVNICEIVSDMLDEKEMSGFMSNLSGMMSMLLSTIVSISIVFIVSTALLLVVCSNSL